MRVKFFTDYTFGKHGNKEVSPLELKVNKFLKQIEKTHNVDDVKITCWADDEECESTVMVMYTKKEKEKRTNQIGINVEMDGETIGRKTVEEIDNQMKRRGPYGKFSS